MKISVKSIREPFSNQKKIVWDQESTLHSHQFLSVFVLLNRLRPRSQVDSPTAGLKKYSSSAHVFGQYFDFLAVFIKWFAPPVTGHRGVKILLSMPWMCLEAIPVYERQIEKTFWMILVHCMCRRCTERFLVGFWFITQSKGPCWILHCTRLDLLFLEGIDFQCIFKILKAAS